MSQVCKRIIGYILLMIFTVYYVDIAFFKHCHIINGVTIVHSHFYSSEHAQAGTHNTTQLTMISTLSDFQSTQLSYGFIGVGIFLLLIAILRLAPEKKIIPAPVFHYALRAPPTFF